MDLRYRPDRPKHTSFRFKPEVKAAFQHECEINSVSMTKVLEKFMISYVLKSRSLRKIDLNEEE